jgi:reactive intermediate/imine deaminase
MEARHMLKFIRSRGSIDAGLPFSDAVRAGDVLYLSGALGNVPGKMELVGGGIAGETRQMMQNIARTLEQNDLDFDAVFKCTVMLADMNEWRTFNAVYLEYFKPDRLPSRSAFGAAGLALGARVEMECCAWAAAK